MCAREPVRLCARAKKSIKCKYYVCECKSSPSFLARSRSLLHIHLLNIGSANCQLGWAFSIDASFGSALCASLPSPAATFSACTLFRIASCHRTQIFALHKNAFPRKNALPCAHTWALRPYFLDICRHCRSFCLPQTVECLCNGRAAANDKAHSGRSSKTTRFMRLSVRYSRGLWPTEPICFT